RGGTGGRREMRPLLEGAARGGQPHRSPRPVSALRRRGGVRPGLPAHLTMGATRALRIGLIAGLIVLIADQVSKWWVLEVLRLPELRQVVLLPVLSLTMVWNQGVTFGLLHGFGTW